MLYAVSLVLGLVVTADGAGAVRVSAAGPTLTVVAQGASLSAVLEEIGRQSGTRVTYDGAAPTSPVTCNFVAATPREAFVRALEGLGLNYALYGGSPDVPGVLLVSVPFGAAARRNPVAGNAAPVVREVELGADGEPVAVTNLADEAVAVPPPEGAVPPRFGGPGQAEPVSDKADDGDRPAGARGPNGSGTGEGSPQQGRRRMQEEGRRRGSRPPQD